MHTQVIKSLTEISAEKWNACCDNRNPFMRWEFLMNLEITQCVGPSTGWDHWYGLVYQNTELVAIWPMYLKSHSYGEYVFDSQWAHFSHQLGHAYFPKLVVSIPFTPATCSRIGLAEGIALSDVIEHIKHQLLEMADTLNASSIHILYLTDNEKDSFENVQFSVRKGFQYYWRNEGYATFDEFLAKLTVNRRKSIRKHLNQSSLVIERIEGDAITDHHMDFLWQCYQDTTSRKWGEAYLTEAWFQSIHHHLSSHMVLFLAKDEGYYTAGSLNFSAGDQLYGRYWGALNDIKYLHFECCYYQLIDHAIHHRYQRIDAGVQGEHKFIRGFQPTPTYSCHWIKQPVLRDVVNQFIALETKEIDRLIQEYRKVAPFKDKNK